MACRAAVSAAVALAASVLAQGASWDAALHLLPSAQQEKFGAHCLDGSAPGFYYRPGAAGSTKWKFHMQGGGWCTGAQDCYWRSQSILGSSATWTPWLSTFWPPEGAGFYGLMDNNASSTNPFGDWHFVWHAYCDGSSQTSDSETPVVFNGTQLHMRGRAVLDANLDELEQLYGFLSTATEVLISGTSAGGLSTYLHSGYIKSLLKPTARLVAVPDAGFFLDHASFVDGGHNFYKTVAGAIGPELWNATLRGGGARCLADLAPQGLAPRCFFPQYLYKYLTDVDGVFIMQSLYDTANLGICYQLNCNLYTTCNATEVAAVQSYSRDLLSNVSAAQATFARRDAAFLTACYQHEESCRARDWYGIVIGGQNANSTFYNWYAHGVGPDAARVDVPWPGDETCAPQGSMNHGAC